MSDTEQPEGVASSDWKRDPIWHWRNWVLALITLIFAVASYIYGDFHKPVKALTCDLVAVGPLVSVEDDVNKRVQVVFDGKPVANAKFALIKVANAGNVPIEEADFKRPLTLHFGGSGTNTILTAQLLNSYPSNMGATYKANGDTLTLAPLLLNPGDNITLKVIYTGTGESMNVEARIVGVSEVTGTDPDGAKKAENKQAFIRGIMWAGLLIFILWVITQLIAYLVERAGHDPTYFRQFLRLAKIDPKTLSPEDFAWLQERHRERVTNTKKR